MTQEQFEVLKKLAPPCGHYDGAPEHWFRWETKKDDASMLEVTCYTCGAAVQHLWDSFSETQLEAMLASIQAYGRYRGQA